MPILGINYENCVNCHTCIKICTRLLFNETEQDEIIFQELSGYDFISYSPSFQEAYKRFRVVTYLLNYLLTKNRYKKDFKTN